MVVMSLLRLIFLFGALALVIGPFPLAPDQARPLPAETPHSSPLGDGPFIAEGFYPNTHRQELPADLPTRGSWVYSDAFCGEHTTAWLVARPTVFVAIAGYPKTGDNRLELHVRHRDGTLEIRPFLGDEPGYTWRRWRIDLPPTAVAVRVHAIDATPRDHGWVAFSTPFAEEPSFPRQAWALLQVLTATCLALTLLAGPGLLWFLARPRPLSALAFAILPGPLTLAALGVAIWALGGIIAPTTLARLGISAVLLFLAWRFRRATAPLPPAEIRAVLSAGALLAGFAVAKASFSLGPPGELYRGTISRTLAVGGHSDSRISFHMVQVIAHHLAPFEEQSRQYFAPWTIASRGPLAGLLAAPIVLATGADVPLGFPEAAWRPFDPEGFAVYRVTLIVLASLATWAVVGVLAALTSPAWATFGGVLALLAPFFVHELYFTWPKLITAGIALAAFLFAHERRPLAAGLALGVAYLFHPLALLSAPVVAVWSFVRVSANSIRPRLLASALFGIGLVLLVAPWQTLGRLAPNRAGAQSAFVAYFRLADNAPATPQTWLRSRWHNFAHTFLPGHLLSADPAHESLNAVGQRSDRWTRTSFLWWNTLPFALGLPAFLLCVLALAQALRRAPGIALLSVVFPAALLVIYWGAADTGLMRHAGHVLFLSVVTLATWSLAQSPQTASIRPSLSSHATRLFLHPLCFLWRAAEIILVAFGTTLLHQRPALASRYGYNDLLSLFVAFACLGYAVFLLAKTTGSLRSTFSSQTI